MEEEAQLLVKEQNISDSGVKMRKKEVVYRRRAKSNGKGRAKEKERPLLLDHQVLVRDHAEETDASVSGVSLFDDSAENHFKAMDKISVLCREEEPGSIDEDEVKRLNETVTLLSEWRYFNYKPRTIRFASETGAAQEKDVNEISLPQFSSATVPSVESLSNEAKPIQSRNDFVFYAGGSVWALDWCPRPDMAPDSLINCQFIAVSAHPPDSSYHKLGACLSGRGMVQIWCLLNYREKEEDVSSLLKPCNKFKKRKMGKEDDTQPKRPRGRPRKHPIKTTTTNVDCEIQPVEVLAIEYPESGSNVASIAKGDEAQPKKPRGRLKKKSTKPASDNLHCESQTVEVLAIEYPESGSNVASVAKGDEAQPKRPRGQRKKKSTKPASDNLHCESQTVEVLAIEYPENGSNVASVAKGDEAQPKRPRGQRKKQSMKAASDNLHGGSQTVEVLAIEYPGSNSNVGHVDVDPVTKSYSNSESVGSSQKRKWKAKARISKNIERVDLPSRIHHTDEGPSTTNQTEEHSEKSKKVTVSKVGHDDGSRSGFVGSSPTPKDILPPRVVLCLGHDGKVAWDLKWRPSSSSSSNFKYRLGYLGVLLGDGSLEVWEIPSPRTLKAIYQSRNQEHTDPRFVKLKPVFRCSILRCGGRQSIPLTLEWSRSSPHDLILAGCHDGMVALWKFSPSSSPKDSRPLLCFSADTVPIRALAWAPSEGDPESGNIIVTAGHEGMKFWDLRDPFRPLWDISAQRFIYSLDWLFDPRCILTSYDDGTLRLLSLSKAAYDVPVTGKPFTGTQQQGLHSFVCSSFAIWSVQVSQHTGMVAYCGSDGTVLYFQLTSRAVDKDPSRNRAPHFLCGSLTDEDGVLVVNTPLSNAPYPMKRSINEWGNTPRSLRGFVNDSNQARRAKDGSAKKLKADNQPLALCYGNDNIDEDTNLPLSALNPKSKTSTRKKAIENKASASNNEDAESLNGKTDLNQEADIEIESLPSKLVAVHRVRWNLNKGSERWLCYGGSSGIVRCQKINPPEFDPKRLKS